MLLGVLITAASPLFGELLPLVKVIFPLTSSAFIGAPVVSLVMIVVSLLTRPPSDEMVAFLIRDVHDTGGK